MRFLLLTTAVLIGLTAPAVAAGCEHYAGHFDLEGKIGNQRNIGEASAFLPFACTQDRLLFTDLKFRADNLSNREANIGIGGRVQREEGIAGGYIYFDRKKSGETDKFYNQITTGAEWLADHWETRANVYIPLNGSKTIGNGVVVSDPYLAGTGIFIDRGGFQIKETPMYGADAEIGFNTIENLWLYGGGFTFHGNDVPTITGARVRAKYDLTDKVSLNAEGQYDDERGRQGWLGARLSVPFGKASATRSRMTQSPVRDVDIVTQAKTTFEPQITTALANPESGDAQRVIYVNNRANPNGDGSLENPYNTLADAQGDLRDYDIVYVYHGDGTTTGQDQGFVIDKNNVAFIGEGSPLTFAGYTFLQSGEKPTVTNTLPSTNNLTGNGLLVTGRNVSVSGLNIDQASLNGVFVYAESDNLGNFEMNNVELSNNSSFGLYAYARQGGRFDHINLNNVQARTNSGGGIEVYAANTASSVGAVSMNRVESVGNSARGIRIYTDAGKIENINLSNFSANENNIYGFVLFATNNGVLENIKVMNGEVRDNNNVGVIVQTTDGGVIEFAELSGMDILESSSAGIYVIARNEHSRITDFTFQNSNVNDSTGIGVYVRAQEDAKISNVNLANVIALRNGGIAGADFEVNDLGSTISNVNVRDSSFSENVNRGIRFSARSPGAMIRDVDVQNVTANNNGLFGIILYSSAGLIENVNVSGGSAANNVIDGVIIDVESGGIISQSNLSNLDIINNQRSGFRIIGAAVNGTDIDVSLNGGNRLFGNGSATGSSTDLVVVQTGAPITLLARNNWWGQSVGPVIPQVHVNNIAQLDLRYFLSEDPRP